LDDFVERRKHPRIPVRWPITIITEDGTIEGESRNITVAGIFVHCPKQLRTNEIHQLIINIPKQQSILVKGQVMWSNFGGKDRDSDFRGMGFCFIKISDEDRQLLTDVISKYAKPEGKAEPPA
jgi:hypothetical protein